MACHQLCHPGLLEGQQCILRHLVCHRDMSVLTLPLNPDIYLPVSLIEHMGCLQYIQGLIKFKSGLSILSPCLFIQILHTCKVISGRRYSFRYSTAELLYCSAFQTQCFPVRLVEQGMSPVHTRVKKTVSC